MQEKKVICTVCPRGCEMKVTEDGGKVTVVGATCARGRAYGQEELVNPTRVITTTVRVAPQISDIGLLPVKSSAPVPKRLLREIAAQCRLVTVDRKVAPGDVIISDVLGTGADIIAASHS